MTFYQPAMDDAIATADDIDIVEQPVRTATWEHEELAQVSLSIN